MRIFVKSKRTTTTEDAEGETVEAHNAYQSYTREQILAALASLTGVIEQTPPMFSAVKVNLSITHHQFVHHFLIILN